MNYKLFLFVGVVLILQSPFSMAAPGVSDIINSAGKKIGTANFQTSKNGVEIRLLIKGLSPGKHGIHIHETGKCEGPDFKSAGGHFNPFNKQHGKSNPKGTHAGLPGLEVGPDGTVDSKLSANEVTLENAENSLFRSAGTSIVIHANADDQKTDPSGNSGERIACGVIRKK